MQPRIPTAERKRIAVIGGGVAGLGAALTLTDIGHLPTLYEASSQLGGHANTVPVSMPDRNGKLVTYGVDTGFLVYNENTYPNLIELFRRLKIKSSASAMTFSVRTNAGLEWGGHNLASVFAQRRNLVSPKFLKMLIDIVRFNRLALKHHTENSSNPEQLSVGGFLRKHGFSEAFRNGYLLPMIASIWSCPTQQMLAFPMQTLANFCANHGLLQISNRPQWYSVLGGSRNYVDSIAKYLPDVKTSTRVVRVIRQSHRVIVQDDHEAREFDGVVFACHANQTLALLSDLANSAEIQCLGAIKTQENLAVLHTDSSVMPKRRKAWAAWNYQQSTSIQHKHTRVCLHYWLNALQVLPFEQDIFVSLNPIDAIPTDRILDTFVYHHPVFDQPAIQAQASIAALQGTQLSAFAGAWTKYGFHEDGLSSGISAAHMLSNALMNTAAKADPLILHPLILQSAP